MARSLLAEARCEVALISPFALLGGGLYGYGLAADLGGRVALAVAAFCALGLTALIAIQISLEPLVVDALGGRDGRFGQIAAYLWDVGTGAAASLPLMLLTSVGTVPSMGLALTVGSVYGYVVGALICGDATEMAVTTLLGGAGRARAGYSHIEAMEARGDLEGAAHAWREALRANPDDGRPYLALARLLPARTDGRRKAVEVLRLALARARLTPEQERMALMRLVELREDGGRRAAAAPDLARYLEGGASGPPAEWARRVLADIKTSLAREAREG